MAFVFDNERLTNSIYIEGLLDKAEHVNSSMNKMNRSNDSAISYSYYDILLQVYYSGIIDQLIFSFRVKNVSKLLNEAILF